MKSIQPKDPTKDNNYIGIVMSANGNVRTSKRHWNLLMTEVQFVVSTKWCLSHCCCECLGRCGYGCRYVHVVVQL